MNTNLQARNATANADGTPSRTCFGAGLYLITTKAGTKTWRCNYIRNGRYGVATLGRYPAMKPSEAAAARQAVKDTVKAGGNPAVDRLKIKIATMADHDTTVRTVAKRWTARGPDIRDWSAGYAVQVERRLERHVLPVIGDLPISLVTTQHIETLIDRLVKLKLRAQAVHVRHHLQCLFDYAFSHDLVPINVVRKIGGELPRRKRNDEREIKRARVGTIEEARQVLQAVESARAGGFLKLVHRLIALTGVRKMEAVEADWSEFNEAEQTWTIPGARMKGRRGQKQEHVIPLSPQALEVFQAARKLADVQGIQSSMVFPGRGVDCIKRSSLNDLLTRVLTGGLAGKHCVHGWRGTFSTIQNTEEPRDREIIEVMLAHKTQSNVAGRYNDSIYLAARLEIACKWADKLLVGMPSAFQVAGIDRHRDNVVPFKKEAA